MFLTLKKILVNYLDTGLRLALQNFKTYDFDFGKNSNSKTFVFGMITRSSYMYTYAFLDIK
jgi:hypothetical protein